MLITTVHRKPSHTKYYIHSLSLPSPSKNSYGGVKMMQDRANKVCDSTSKTTELQHLQDVFQDNGFPMDLVRKDLAVLSHCGTETAGEGVTVQRQVEGFWQRRTVEAIQMGKSILNMNFDSSSLSLKLNPEPARTSHLAPPTFFHIIHIFYSTCISLLFLYFHCWMVHAFFT